MATDYSICLGTAGWGVWHSSDAGKSWVRHRAPFPLNSRIQALVVHPTEPHTIFAGGGTGLFFSQNGGGAWEGVRGPREVSTTWFAAHSALEAPSLLSRRATCRGV